MSDKSNLGKAGWRVSEWAGNVGIGRAFTYELIRDKKIRSVKIGSARIIITPPKEFLRSVEEQQKLL